MESKTINQIKKGRNFLMNIPGSKSLSIRALILASMAHGTSTIENVLNSDDTKDCIKALESLGVKVKNIKNQFEVEGCCGIFPFEKETIYFGSSGITGRFLLAMICASLSKEGKYRKIILDASEQLRGRTIKPLVDTLKSIGADITYLGKEGFFPLLVKTAKLNNIDNIEVSGAISSQYVSAILMMAPLLDRATKIHIKDINSLEHPYIKMALAGMKDFGIDNIVEESDNVYNITPQTYKPTDFKIESDLNTANYFFAIAAATGGSVIIDNINKNSLQPGLIFLRLLKMMGCKIYSEGDTILLTAPKKLKSVPKINMFYIAEMTPLLAVLAVFANAPTKIHGIEHIRNHECDRISAICTELKKAGIEVTEFKDGLEIRPGNPQFIEANTYNDHRIAMSLTVLGLAGNGIKILNPKCVSKTCPEFFELIKEIDNHYFLQVSKLYDDCCASIKEECYTSTRNRRLI